MSSSLELGNKRLEEFLSRGITCTPLASESDMNGLTCAICLGLLTSPLMHPTCGNMFCAGCVSGLTSCPLCRGSLEGAAAFVQAPKLVQNTLNDMKVRCDLCHAEMKREEFKQTHCRTCVFPCPLDCGCQVTMETLREHCQSGACCGYTLSCPASEPPLSCTWRGFGGQAYTNHVSTCPLVKFIPLVGWAKETVARLEGNISELERTVAELEAQPQHHHRKHRSGSSKDAQHIEPSAPLMHSGEFSVGGVGCPGICCPICKRQARNCPEGGRYKCCGLCKACGPCLKH